MTGTVAPTRTEILVVGTGFAGLGIAARLEQQGRDDYVVIERAGDVGGTWRDNTYPGAACDVPSHLYSLSFAPNPDWSRSFSPQPEIHQYLRDVADRFGVRSKIRFGCELLDAHWDETAAQWCVRTNRGEFTARFLVAGTGALSEPALPALPGLDSFEGTAFHSARWDHDHDLSGERVAVIGTGASAIQFVPQIQPKVAQLDLFQRTPAWIIPRWDRRFTSLERWMFRNVPLTQRLARTGIYWGREIYVVGFAFEPQFLGIARTIALNHLRRQVPDPALRAALTPDYMIGCKRILISNDFYPSLTEPNVELVTDPIAEVRRRSIVTHDGSEREVDTIIFGTGFQVTDLPIASRIVGRGGLSLREHWKEGMRAYRGTTVPGFPNMFILLGPNTGLGHSSQVFMIESQITYALDALGHAARTGARTVEVTPDAEAAWNERVQADMEGTVWTSGGCSSWYLDENGRNTTLWPGFTWQFRRETHRFDPAAYEIAEHPVAAAVVGA